MRKLVGVAFAIMFLTLAEAAFAQALVTHFHQFDTFTGVVFVPCANGGAGEDVLLSGTLHTQIHMTTNRNRISFKAQVKPQVVTGIGLISGDVYRAVGVTQFSEIFPGDAGQGSHIIDSVNVFRLIGPGPGNNFQVHQLVHQTFNANGELTSSVSNDDVACN